MMFGTMILLDAIFDAGTHSVFFREAPEILKGPRAEAR